MALLYGWAVLTAEMALVRLVTPYVGASLPVWASVIGLVLVSLAVGAMAGGRLSRRGAVRTTLFGGLVLAGVLLLATPWMLRPLLGVVAAGGTWQPAAVVTLVILAGLPLVTAGTFSPLLVQGRASARDATAGSAAGWVSASTTVGSLFGSLLPAFVLLPLLGTSRTYVLAGGALLLAALLLRPPRPRKGAAALAAGAWGLLLVGGMLSPLSLVPRRPGTLAELESLQHHIAVVRRPAGHRVLLLDSGLGESSYWDPSERRFYGPWPLLAVSPLLLNARDGLPPRHAPLRVLLIGLGGGTAARMLVRAFPRARVLGVEVDPGIVRVARRYLDLRHPRIRVRIGDGRVVLTRRPTNSADVILLDAYRDLYVPFHLATEEFFRQARRVLRPGGVLVLNLVRMDVRDSLTHAVARTLARVFARVHVVDVPGGTNRLLVAGSHAVDRDAVLARTRTMTPVELARFASQGLSSLRLWSGPKAGPCFTDDRSPVEYLTHRALLRRWLGW